MFNTEQRPLVGVEHPRSMRGAAASRDVALQVMLTGSRDAAAFSWSFSAKSELYRLRQQRRRNLPANPRPQNAGPERSVAAIPALRRRTPEEERTDTVEPDKPDLQPTRSRHMPSRAPPGRPEWFGPSRPLATATGARAQVRTSRCRTEAFSGSRHDRGDRYWGRAIAVDAQRSCCTRTDIDDPTTSVGATISDMNCCCPAVLKIGHLSGRAERQGLARG